MRNIKKKLNTNFLKKKKISIPPITRNPKLNKKKIKNFPYEFEGNFDKISNKKSKPLVGIEMDEINLKKSQNLIELKDANNFKIPNENLDKLKNLLEKKINFDDLNDEDKFRAVFSTLQIFKLKESNLTKAQKGFLKEIGGNDKTKKLLEEIKDKFIKSQIKDIFGESEKNMGNFKLIRTYFEDEIILKTLEGKSANFKTFEKEKDSFFTSLKNNIEEIKDIANSPEKIIESDFSNINDKKLEHLHIILEELEVAQHYDKSKEFLNIFFGNRNPNIDNLIKLKLEVQRLLIKRKRNFKKYNKSEESLENVNELFGGSNNKKLRNVESEYEYNGLSDFSDLLNSNAGLRYFMSDKFDEVKVFKDYEIFGKKVEIKKLSDISFDELLELNDYFEKMKEGLDFLDRRILDKQAIEAGQKRTFMNQLLAYDERWARRKLLKNEGTNEYAKKDLDNYNNTDPLINNQPNFFYLTNNMNNPNNNFLGDNNLGFLGGGLKNIDHFTNTVRSQSQLTSTNTENYVDKILNSNLMKKINQKNIDNRISLLITIKNIYEKLNENQREIFLISNDDEKIEYLIKINNSIVKQIQEENQEDDSLIKKYKEIVLIHNNNNKFINILFIIITINILFFIIIFLRK